MFLWQFERSWPPEGTAGELDPMSLAASPSPVRKTDTLARREVPGRALRRLLS